ncbi:MAG: TonB-dependent receptor [Elusimicrobia bacterium]|nr:TonB-dependent receptor [Elusimicrobiota bacterium]
MTCSSKCRLIAACLLTASPVFAGQEDAFEFLAEEVTVVTASRRPQSITRAPATVYVLTQEDIKASGAQTLWDAFRQLPGMEVVTARTFSGEVSVRGQNQPLSSHTLVLLDGRTQLWSVFNTITWEALPVTLEEIDRIEVVQGPFSAIYGANAVMGVINIITKKPEQLKGGVASYTGGERKTHFGSLVYGKQMEKVGYKVGLGSRSTNRFSRADLRAGDATKAHSEVNVRLGEKADLSVSGALVNSNTQVTTGGTGVTYLDGPSGFLRTDLSYGNTKFRTFWNHTNWQWRELLLFGQPNLNEDTYDVNLEQSIPLPASNDLVVGANYRKNTIKSTIFDSPRRDQHLWAMFFEDFWRPLEKWTFVASGRYDHHPLAGGMFTPRTSAVFAPVSAHTLRLSLGSAFKYPTLLENYLLLTPTLPNPGNPPLTNPPFLYTRVTNRGSKNLVAERMSMVELSHNGNFRRVKTTTVGYYYKLKDNIKRGPVAINLPVVPPTVTGSTNFENKGYTIAWGGETGVEVRMTRKWTTFANYSYHSLKDEYPRFNGGAPSSPKHKANGGVRLKSGGLSSGLWVHWTDKTFWNASQPGLDVVWMKVKDYMLLNAYVGYAFQQRWKGLEAAVSAFDLGNNTHYETLPRQNASQPGLNGEIVRARLTGTVSYRF